MTTHLHRGSANIYEFPARGRFAEKRDDSSPVSNPTSLHFAKTTFGSAWYHEEAVQDAERGGKN
jgi:Protein of unknown function (DUF2735)